MKGDFIQLLNTGDLSTYKQVFDLYYKRLCAFAYRYVEDTAETEDIIQEVFLSLWEHKRDFDHIDAIKAFLYTSVRNNCLNYLKHRKVVQKHGTALVRELESDHFFTDHIIEEEVFAQLYSEIKNLPASAQKIMLLTLKGMKVREIAEELGISENTVKTQKKIAYAKLREKISDSIKGILLAL